MAITVCKFGGTSMADGNVLKRVKNIIDADSTRKFIVVSAPGKRYSADSKVTDLLYKCYDELSQGKDCNSTLAEFKKRMVGIVKELGIQSDIENIIAKTESEIRQNINVDFIISRGEYLTAIIMSTFLDAKFIDSKDVVFFDSEGKLDGEKTYSAIARAVKGCKKAVFPGFYGSDVNGDVKTFSRGGSDITGAIVARAVGASVYENWTDVCGFLACDPKIVNSPQRISSLSYKELRELSYMGANVLHSESVFPVLSAGIPIYIKNTFNPEQQGTCITAVSHHSPSGNVVTGIAGKKDFTVVFIEKSMMNSEVGFAKRVLEVFEHFNISIEHIPTGIDTMSIIFESKEADEATLKSVIEGLKKAVSPDGVRVNRDIALVATVGHGMSASVGTSARLFKALADAGVNVNMIDQGSSELNIIVGIKNSDYERCISAIYREFFN